MKFLLLKWLIKPSSLCLFDQPQWKQVVDLAKNVARDNELDLINLSLVKKDLEMFLFGNEHKVNNFIKELRFELYLYLRKVNNGYGNKALSNFYLIEELEESDSRLIEAVRLGLLTYKACGLLNRLVYCNKEANKTPMKSLSIP